MSLTDFKILEKLGNFLCLINLGEGAYSIVYKV